MPLTKPRRSETTTELPAQRPRTYFPSPELQTVELVVRSATPLAHTHVRGCLETFIELANAGFFTDGGLIPGPVASSIVDEHEAGVGSSGEAAPTMGAWTLAVAAVGARGLVWLHGALREIGAQVEHCSVVVADALAAGSRIQAVLPTFPFRIVSRRAVSGFYLRLGLSAPATDEQEQAFRALVTRWTSLVLGLPSRDGRARSSITLKPSFERGGHVLAVAGRDLDVVRGDAEISLLSALAHFHRQVAPLHELTVELS
jgi:hypothetical protein